MSNPYTLYMGSDTILELAGLKNELNGADLNAATVTVTLRDADGQEVGGETWPKALTYVAGSKGVYRATLPHTLALVANARYTGVVTADGGAGLRARWDIECIARLRA